MTDFKEQNRIFLNGLAAQAQERPDIVEILSETVRLVELSPIEASFLNEGCMTQLTKGAVYRYGLPSLEMAQFKNPKVAARALCFQLHCIFLWRALDDLVDEDVEPRSGTQKFTSALTSCIEFSEASLGISSITSLRQLQKAISEMTGACQDGDTSAQSIINRASLHILPLRIFGADHTRIAAFEKYCVIFGILHDVADVFDDVRSGTKTAPTEWLSNTSAMSTFSKVAAVDFFSHFEAVTGTHISELDALHSIKRGTFTGNNLEFGLRTVFAKELFE